MQQLAAESGAIIRGYFFDPELSVDEKSDQSPVTIADRRAEELLRERIRARYPGHGIIGEEFGNENEGAEYVWVLDPTDYSALTLVTCYPFSYVGSAPRRFIVRAKGDQGGK